MRKKELQFHEKQKRKHQGPTQGGAPSTRNINEIEEESSSSKRSLSSDSTAAKQQQLEKVSPIKMLSPSDILTLQPNPLH